MSCFSCGILQARQQTKAKSFTCKVCNSPQSFQKILFTGTGAECRQFLTSRNTAKHAPQIDLALDLDQGQAQIPNQVTILDPNSSLSRWSVFLDEVQQEDEDQEDGHVVERRVDEKDLQKKEKGKGGKRGSKEVQPEQQDDSKRQKSSKWDVFLDGEE